MTTKQNKTKQNKYTIQIVTSKSGSDKYVILNDPKIGVCSREEGKLVKSLKCYYVYKFTENLNVRVNVTFGT